MKGRTRRAKKVASRPCEELEPEAMRTVPEEDLAENLLEMSFEVLRGSDGEGSASGRTSRGTGMGKMCLLGVSRSRIN